MPDNNIYGVDFIARCMAGEALDKAGQKSWTLVAGNNISILSDEEEKTETISAEIEIDDALSSTSTNPVENRVIYDALQNVEIDVDDALSTTSENPVQNKVITNTLATKPTSVLPDGTVISNQKIMALTRAQYNAIQSKDPNTYYMITDDPVPSPINVRTAFVDLTADAVETTLEGMKAFRIPVPQNFTALEVSFNFTGEATSGEWNLAFPQYDYSFVVTPNTTRERGGQQVGMVEGHTKTGEAATKRFMGDVSFIRYYAEYDNVNNTVTVAVSTPFVAQADETGVDDNTTNAAWTSFTVNRLGYVAYGPNNVVISDAFTAGTGITINGTEIGLTDAPAADVIARLSNGDLTIQIEDADGVPMGAGATVTLPVELPASTSSDSGKVLTVDSNGDPEWSAGQSFTQVQSDWSQSNSSAVDYIKNKPDLSVYETSSHASSTYQTQAGMSGYATTNDISDMATQTWVGQQGFLTSADEVPAVTSNDDGKVLTADYTGGTGSYSWETVPTPADMATQTWVGQQGYLTSADEVPAVGSSDDGKVLTATYSGGTGSYAWATPAAGGLQVETDGTNYWITVNGIRLYFASSAPTGNIPAGSLGIGW